MVEDDSNLTYSDGEDDAPRVRHERTTAVTTINHRKEDSDSLMVSHHDDDEEEYRRRHGDGDSERKYVGEDQYSYDDDDDDEEGSHCEDEEDDDAVETIALFGVEGRTGHHFLRLALDAGYKVRALVPPSMKKMEGDFDDLYTVVGTLSDQPKIQEVVYSSTYVVCMIGETLLAKPGEYPKDCQLKFVKTLYRFMEREDDPGIQGLLFQTTSLAANQWGELPSLANHFRKYWTRRPTQKYLEDVDAVTKYVYSRSWGSDKVLFPYIITRPTSFLRDGRSTKKLRASKSQPGPFPYCYVDLAEFSLNALKMKKLQNTCRYVVGDGC